MWENIYQVVYDGWGEKVGENPRQRIAVQEPINEGAQLGYTVVEFDYGIEDGSGWALMKCIRCHAVDEGRTPSCSVHGHQRR